MMLRFARPIRCSRLIPRCPLGLWRIAAPPGGLAGLVLCIALLLPTRGAAAPGAQRPADAPPGAQHAQGGRRTDARRAEARRYFREGKKRFALRQFRRALKAFSRAYEILPLSGFLFNIGQCHRFLGDCQKAIFFYNGFVRENPGTPDAAFVRKLIRRCQQAEARVRARRERAQRLFEAGRRAATLQQYGEAIARFTAAYKAYPRPGYLYHLAEAHRLRGDYEHAVHFYEAYLRETPGAPQTPAVRVLLSKSRRLAAEARRQKRARLAVRVKPPRTPAPPPPTPLYKRWWFWTAVAAGLVAAVGLGVGLTRETSSPSPGPSLGTFDIARSLQ